MNPHVASILKLSNPTQPSHGQVSFHVSQSPATAFTKDSEIRVQKRLEGQWSRPTSQDTNIRFHAGWTKRWASPCTLPMVRPAPLLCHWFRCDHRSTSTQGLWLDWNPLAALGEWHGTAPLGWRSSVQGSKATGCDRFPLVRWRKSMTLTLNQS